MKLLRIAACLWICLLGPVRTAAGLEAGVMPEIIYKYYPVNYTKGISPINLIVRDTPLSGQNGHRHLGNCLWRIKYETNTFTRPTIGVCRIDKPKVRVECEITLARLKGGGNDPDFQRRFDESVEKTRRHELRHCEIAVRHADSLLESFTQMKERKCEDLRQAMKDEHRRIREACSVDQKRFDHAAYGYKQYLRLEGLQRMVDAGFNVVPPPEGRSMPRLNSRGAHKNMEVLVPEGAENLREKGIYKDENGVWRNH